MDWSNERWSNSESFAGQGLCTGAHRLPAGGGSGRSVGRAHGAQGAEERSGRGAQPVQHRPRHRRGHPHITRPRRRGGRRMAAADRTRRKQRGQCARSPQLLRWSCILFWGAVWVWFGARTLRAANRVLACQQFGCACLHAACLGARLEQLQRAMSWSTARRWGTGAPTTAWITPPKRAQR